MKDKLAARLGGALTLRDCLVVALLAALGLALKLVGGTPIKALAGAIGVPGGMLAGGVYMFVPVMAPYITGKPISAAMLGVVQGGLALLTGIGSHGPLSFVTYGVPGLLIFCVFFLWPKAPALAALAAGALGNISGSVLVNLLFFRLPVPYLAMLLCLAAFSGGVGGFVAYLCATRLKAINKKRTEE